MQSRARSIDSWVKDSSSSEDILVICGMGGIGKTTIAKHVYNLNFQRFDASSFLASVKEESERSNGLVKLQRQLLSSILKGKKEEIYNVDEGIIKINEAICCKRVLLVIDDVDEVKQLDALLGTRDQFYPGSKIIITTRNKSLLKAHEVHKLDTVEKLDDDESLVLFCWHAFGKEHPANGYLELSKRAVNHCGGLPLAHEILGSSLVGKSTKVWESTLQKLESIPEIKILNVLKTSFDSLQEDHDKNLFLHIACFFVGHDMDEMIDILDSCDFFTVCGIQNLVDRCLISIENKKLMMHQLLEDMGRKIVDQESPNEPWRRSRLWRPKDSFMVLKEKRGTETIEGLVLDMQMYKDEDFNIRKRRKRPYDEICDTILPPNDVRGTSFRRRYFNFLSSEPLTEVGFKFDAFLRMDKLRFLKLNYTKLSGCPENFPEGLRWLCCHGFPFNSIPFDLPLRNLVSLDMSYSKLEHVWIRNKVLLSLKILNLSHSPRLIKTPNFRGLPNLEKLILKGCVSLVDVCDTIGDLERLALLNLENCKSLRRFPNIGMLKSLQSLVVDGCSNIFSESLKVVDANGVAVNPSPSTFRDKVKQWYTFFQPWVSKPILKNPQQIVSFPHSLVSLSLQNCNLSDDDFPLDLSQLSSLERLDLSNNLFLNLPQCISSLGMLSWLSLVSCEELHTISSLQPNISFLNVSKCRSLERVTYQSTLTRPFVNLRGCGKLIDIRRMFKLEPMDKVNREILDNLGLCDVEFIRNLKLSLAYVDRLFDLEEKIRQGLYEFGIFSTFLYLEEIPSWCIDGSSKRGSSSVSFVIPSYPSLRVRGLNVYSMYKLCNKYRYPFLLFVKISNKTKDLSWIYTPVIVGIPEDELVWLSHWKFGSQLESGDEVYVSAVATDGYGFHITEVGINLVWGEEEEEEMNGTHNNHHDNTRGDVIGEDLSSFQFMNTQTFFLTHQFICSEYSSCAWFGKLFGDHVTREDFEEWMWDEKRYQS